MYYAQTELNLRCQLNFESFIFVLNEMSILFKQGYSQPIFKSL